MFNPNSAFPRQTTYTPYTGHNIVHRAVNAPNFAPNGPGGLAMMPNTRGAYAAIVQNAARQANGAPGIAAAVTSLNNRPGPINNMFKRSQAQAAKTQQVIGQKMTQLGKQSAVGDIEQRMEDVIEDDHYPLGRSSIFVPSVTRSSARLQQRPSVFDEVVGGLANIGAKRAARKAGMQPADLSKPFVPPDDYPF